MSCDGFFLYCLICQLFPSGCLQALVPALPERRGWRCRGLRRVLSIPAPTGETSSYSLPIYSHRVLVPCPKIKEHQGFTGVDLPHTTSKNSAPHPDKSNSAAEGCSELGDGPWAPGFRGIRAQAPEENHEGVCHGPITISCREGRAEVLSCGSGLGFCS